MHKELNANGSLKVDTGFAPDVTIYDELYELVLLEAEGKGSTDG